MYHYISFLTVCLFDYLIIYQIAQKPTEHRFIHTYQASVSSLNNRPRITDYLFLLSQLWLPTVQLVLQADWQDVWHSPHPPFLTVLESFFVLSVLICFMIVLLIKKCIFSYLKRLYHN